MEPVKENIAWVALYPKNNIALGYRPSEDAGTPIAVIHDGILSVGLLYPAGTWWVKINLKDGTGMAQHQGKTQSVTFILHADVHEETIEIFFREENGLGEDYTHLSIERATKEEFLEYGKELNKFKKLD